MKISEYTKKQILDAGVQLWREDPNKINARNIAKLINKTHPTIYNHYPNKKHLVEAVASHGVQTGDSVIIVNLLLMGHPMIADIPEDERQKHLNVVRELGMSSKVLDNA